jgi:hypothetical protein
MELFTMTEPFRRRPQPRAVSSEALEAFLRGADTGASPAPPRAAPWPWEQGRADVIKTYVLRLPEPYHMKLQYIAAHTPYSMQRFIQEVLTAAIDAKIAELTDKG